MNNTVDFNNNPVEVVQEEGMLQYIFTYRCAKTKSRAQKTHLLEFLLYATFF